MKTRILNFIDALRDAGLSVTVAETLDAVRAVGIVGIERARFREGLAATLIKDQADRPAFDAAFDRYFAAPVHRRSRRERPQPSGDGQGGPGKPGSTVRAQPTRPQRPHLKTASQERRASETPRERSERQASQKPTQHLLRRRTLLNQPLRDMSPREIDECDDLVRELARNLHASLRRRQRVAQRGRVDVRRTLRRSISVGGIPLYLAFRRRRPGRPDLVALCDTSHSVSAASRFLFALIAPAEHFFHRVRLFAYVDQPVEISVEAGIFIPHETLDLYAQSDFGKVLLAFWARYEPILSRNTVLLILGDARNNRRPPRADLLAHIRGATRHVVWLNPEPIHLWNTGDSVMHSYQRHCDTVLPASTLGELHQALYRTFRGPLR